MATVLDRVRGKNREIEDAERDDERVIDETNRMWEYYKESRRRSEFEWFVNDTYYNNNQFLRYNTGAKRVQVIPAEKLNDRVVINKVKQQVRGVVNFLNAEHPAIGIRPGDQADDSYLRAKKEKHLCDYWYRHLSMNGVVKKISLDGAKYGIGWAKVVWNKDALAPTQPFIMGDGTERDYTYGEVLVDRCDPFDIYPDPTAQTKHDMRGIIHAVVRTIGELKSNPLYRNTDKITPDHKLSASLMKQSELRQSVANAQQISAGSQSNGMDTVVVLEIFRRLYSYENKKWEIWVTTRTEAGVLLRHEKWNLDEFPFEVFQTDIAGRVLDSKGVIHDIREPNRALNEMVSQVHETARIMGKLNWLMPRGSNVNVITDETGQFIEYDVTPGGAPRQAENATLPSYIMAHIGQLNAFIEDISGMHASFNGKPPFAQASGDLVETLSQGDQNNLTMMRDNYDDFFVGMFKLMLKTAKQYYKVSRSFPSSKENEFGEAKWYDLAPDEINTRDDLNISTGTQMPYSIAEKQQMYMNLWKEKAIQDPQILFRLLEMPDIDAAMGDDEDDVERQLDELRQIMKDKEPDDPEIFENHQVHINTIDKFGRGDQWKKLSPKQKQWVRSHRQKHIEFSIQLAQIQASLNMEPIKRSETVMLRMNKMSDTTAVERTQLLAKFGINSDAGEIQLRGGLFIQDPAQAETQAQNEDIEMMNLRAVHVSFADNHLVHLQTHAPVLDQLTAAKKAGQPVDDTIVKLFQDHIKDHVQAMQATMVSPGLVPSETDSMPNPPRLTDTGPPAQMPQSMAKGDEQQQPQGPPPPPEPPEQAKGRDVQKQTQPIAAPASAIAPKTNMPQNDNVKAGKQPNAIIANKKPRGGRSNGRRRKQANQ